MSTHYVECVATVNLNKVSRSEAEILRTKGWLIGGQFATRVFRDGLEFLGRGWVRDESDVFLEKLFGKNALSVTVTSDSDYEHYFECTEDEERAQGKRRAYEAWWEGVCEVREWS